MDFLPQFITYNCIGCVIIINTTFQLVWLQNWSNEMQYFYISFLYRDSSLNDNPCFWTAIHNNTAIHSLKDIFCLVVDLV